MWRFLVVLAACGRKADPPHDAPYMPIVETAEDLLPHKNPGPSMPVGSNTRTMHSTWTNVRVMTRACWYFSGPNGRDTNLSGDVTFTRDGEHVTMTWGNATFRGIYRDDVLDLTRETNHDFQGAWNVKEHFHGEYIGGKVTAHYHYEECATGNKCPNECQIEGDLALTAT